MRKIVFVNLQVFRVITTNCKFNQSYYSMGIDQGVNNTSPLPFSQPCVTDVM